MNYEIEPDGTIILKKSLKEAELLYKAVQSKLIQLRKDPATKETCDQLLGMTITINNAIVESNKARMKNLRENLKKSIENNGITHTEKIGLMHRIINFFDNPFCTHDFEWAHTRCNAKFTIDGMIFAKELYPCEVYGTVDTDPSEWATDQGELQITWNDRGKAFCKSVKNVRDYDLIRNNRKERDSGMVIGFAFILFGFAMFLYYIFS